MFILVFSILSTPLWQNAGGVLPLAFFVKAWTLEPGKVAKLSVPNGWLGSNVLRRGDAPSISPRFSMTVDYPRKTPAKIGI